LGIPYCRQVEDLAYLAAFPGGHEKVPGHDGPRKHLPDPDLEDVDDSPSESSDSEALFPSDEEDNDTNKTDRLRGASKSSLKRTHKLQVGILEGTTFLNNYIVVNTLGRGSFGKVKLCLNVSDDSLYAVKVVDKNAVSGGQAKYLSLTLTLSLYFFP